MAKLPDGLLGLSLISWAVIGIFKDASDVAGLVPVRLSLAALQLMVGWLLIMRPLAKEEGNWQALLLASPSFFVSGIMFRLSLPLSTWPTPAKWIFAGAVVWVIASFWSLRGSFAIFPARRAIVRTGLYKLVRHPAYLGELLMASVCAAASGSLWGGLCLAALIPLLAMRIRKEEALLGVDADYQTYQTKTRWRMLPGIW